MANRKKLIERLANEIEQDQRLIAHQAQQIRDLEKRLAEKTRQRDEWFLVARRCGAKLDAVKERGK